jgi:hypothetical protein
VTFELKLYKIYSKKLRNNRTATSGGRLFPIQ